MLQKGTFNERIILHSIFIVKLQVYWVCAHTVHSDLYMCVFASCSIKSVFVFRRLSTWSLRGVWKLCFSVSRSTGSLCSASLSEGVWSAVWRRSALLSTQVGVCVGCVRVGVGGCTWSLFRIFLVYFHCGKVSGNCFRLLRISSTKEINRLCLIRKNRFFPHSSLKFFPECVCACVCWHSFIKNSNCTLEAIELLIHKSMM